MSKSMEQTHNRPSARKVIITFMGTILLLVFAGQTTAEAHSQVVSANINENAVLKSAPRTFSLTFNEDVTCKAGCLQLLNSTGKILSKSAASDGTTVTLKTATLKPGRYVLRVSVTSPDGHQIIEARAFSVGTKTAQSAGTTFGLADQITGPAGIKVTINGAMAGTRTVTIPLTGTEGVIEWRNPTFGAPVIWALNPNGGSMTATGLLPAGGNWSVTARVRISTFEERVLTGKLPVKP